MEIVFLGKCVLFVFSIVIFYYLSLDLHSVFYHRYSAHRQIVFVNKFWERAFWLLTYIVLGPSYTSPIGYGKTHLAHHKFADKDGDPHSPRFWNDFFVGIWPMMAKTFKMIKEARMGIGEIGRMFKSRQFPSWPDLERFADTGFSMYLFIGIHAFIFYKLAPTPWLYPLIVITIFNMAIQGAYVNWYGHKKGYRNYDTDDLSTNTAAVDLITLGEGGLHNNHHGQMQNPNFARKPGEIDFIYQSIRFYIWLGIMKLHKETK